ncbi:protein kinase [Candidatus Margulisiibacteriota bacterium]
MQNKIISVQQGQGRVGSHNRSKTMQGFRPSAKTRRTNKSFDFGSYSKTFKFKTTKSKKKLLKKIPKRYQKYFNGDFISGNKNLIRGTNKNGDFITAFKAITGPDSKETVWNLLITNKKGVGGQTDPVTDQTIKTVLHLGDKKLSSPLFINFCDKRKTKKKKSQKIVTLTDNLDQKTIKKEESLESTGKFSSMNNAGKSEDGLPLIGKTIEPYNIPNTKKAKKPKKAQNNNVFSHIKNALGEVNLQEFFAKHTDGVLPINDICFYVDKTKKLKIYYTMQKLEKNYKDMKVSFIKLSLEERAKKVLQLVEKVLRYLVVIHGLFFIHRDLKPDNIMWGKGKGDIKEIIRIIDFGLSCHKSKVMKNIKHPGANVYLAPEITKCLVKIIEKETPSIIKSDDVFKGDIWALGIIILELLTTNALNKILSNRFQRYKQENKTAKPAYIYYLSDRAKFVVDDFNGVLTNLEKELGKQKATKGADDNFIKIKALVKQILVPDPKNRPSAQDLLNKHFPQSQGVDPSKQQTSAF